MRLLVIRFLARRALAYLKKADSALVALWCEMNGAGPSSMRSVTGAVMHLNTRHEQEVLLDLIELIDKGVA
ncbi:hypothetical protein [Bifidobacterium parmae]|uniref:Uncharacterized protein n=1 Tax=Bifidobacterium parmae TaxID=361854 RepID=A0A2N5IVM1_9BIFI|nr:hypothetical protein [Bifidobacterium parmae]PLS26003.1 hypothetical protein Uis4E_2178 [Bifidobacterium parmae]